MLKYAEMFKEFLDGKNFASQVQEFEDGETVINFPYGKNAVKCIFAGKEGEYVSLYLDFETVPEEKVIDVVLVCNELNSKFKWIKFYIDPDRDIMLQDDAILANENATDEVFELLIRMIKVSEEVKPVIMKAIYA